MNTRWIMVASLFAATSVGAVPYADAYDPDAYRASIVPCPEPLPPSWTQKITSSKQVCVTMSCICASLAALSLASAYYGTESRFWRMDQAVFQKISPAFKTYVEKHPGLWRLGCVGTGCFSLIASLFYGLFAHIGPKGYGWPSKKKHA